jgi:hypothetical protein
MLSWLFGITPPLWSGGLCFKRPFTILAPGLPCCAHIGQVDRHAVFPELADRELGGRGAIPLSQAMVDRSGPEMPFPDVPEPPIQAPARSRRARLQAPVCLRTLEEVFHDSAPT